MSGLEEVPGESEELSVKCFFRMFPSQRDRVARVVGEHSIFENESHFYRVAVLKYLRELEGVRGDLI